MWFGKTHGLIRMFSEKTQALFRIVFRTCVEWVSKRPRFVPDVFRKDPSSGSNMLRICFEKASRLQYLNENEYYTVWDYIFVIFNL